MFRSANRFYGVAASTTTKAEVSVLPNGLRVVSIDNEGGGAGGAAAVGVFVNAGTRHEKCDQLGASHFLSRLSTFSTFNRSSVRLVHDIENVHSFQVTRGRETTSFTCQVLRNEVPSAASLLLDIIRPRALEYEIRDVAEAVSDDTERSLSCPHLYLENEAHSTAFRAVGVGRSLYSHSTSPLTQEQIIKYLFSNWRDEHTTLVGVNVAHAQLVDAAKANGEIKDVVDGYSSPRTPKPSVYQGGESRRFSSDSVHYSLGFRGFSHSEGGRDVQAVLVRLLATKLGCHWRASSFSYSDSGLITLSSTSSSAIDSAVSVLKGVSFTAAEVEAAKKAVAAQSGVSLVTSPASVLASLVYGEVNIAGVTVEQVHKAAAAALSSPVTLVSVGNSAHLPPPSYLEGKLKN